MVVTSRRPVAVKYKLAFEKYIKKHNLDGFKALVAFSGKVNGKDCGKDSSDIGIDYDAEYTELNLNPDTKNQDLRKVFDQSEYRVMIVANKFQTGFNQPKLVAMYLDKKISGVDAVQTLSRLNRTYPGKDTTYVIDFVNDPEEIKKAFKKYDDGAEIEDIQDLEVINEMQQTLDKARIYTQKELEDFKAINTVNIISSGKKDAAKHNELHKKLYACTQPATDRFNSSLKILNTSIDEWDSSFDKAHKADDKKAMEVAEKKRSELSIQREELMRFKSLLGRFGRTYTYIAQIIELNDPDLENFAGFSKLLSKRLAGISPDNIDLTGLVLKGYEIRKLLDGSTDQEKDKLKPLGGDQGEASDREKEFISKMLGRLNEIFGDTGDSIAQVKLTEDMLERMGRDSNISNQLGTNSKEQALHGDLKKFIKSQLVKNMSMSNDMVRMLLKDSQNFDDYAEFLVDKYMLKKDGKDFNLLDAE